MKKGREKDGRNGREKTHSTEINFCLKPCYKHFGLLTRIKKPVHYSHNAIDGSLSGHKL